MQFPLEGIFNQAENCYLKPDELQQIEQYVASISDRMSSYRAIRDREIDLMQQVADELCLEMPSLEIMILERTIKNGMLVLRHCAMAMLLNDATYLRTRLLSWLTSSIELHKSQTTEAACFRLMRQQLRCSLNAQQMALLEPFLSLVETIVSIQENEEMLTVAGIF